MVMVMVMAMMYSSGTGMDKSLEFGIYTTELGINRWKRRP
jgi:hypothetical protein